MRIRAGGPSELLQRQLRRLAKRRTEGHVDHAGPLPGRQPQPQPSAQPLRAVGVLAQGKPLQDVFRRDDVFFLAERPPRLAVHHPRGPSPAQAVAPDPRGGGASARASGRRWRRRRRGQAAVVPRPSPLPRPGWPRTPAVRRRRLPADAEGDSQQQHRRREEQVPAGRSAARCGPAPPRRPPTPPTSTMAAGASGWLSAPANRRQATSRAARTGSR